MEVSAWKVESVLIRDSWYTVEVGTFTIHDVDLYTQDGPSLRMSRWFEFNERGTNAIMRGPFTSVLALGFSKDADSKAKRACIDTERIEMS